jgi:glycosyltransferase involved in cell wall biosynthesis
MRFYSRLIQARMALTAQRIITISQYSKAQIMRRFGLPADRITVTYLAPGSSFHSRDRSAAQTRIQQTFGLGEYIVALASASPRKNIGHLLQAYAQLATPLRRRFALVLVCSHSLLRESLSHQAERLGISADLVSIDRVEDDCLADLFTAAAVFAFPSLEEGFGLPPLEAMACGTPVIASRTSSMPEVLGRSALLVSPTDSAELADALTNVLTDVDLSRHLIERGRRRSEFFNWPETARQTLAAYHSLAPA